MTRQERKRVYSGDTSSLLQKMNIMNKEDIDKLRDELEEIWKIPALTKGK